MPALRDPYLDPAAEALLAAHPAPRRALFLDRDGVINRNHGYVHTPERTDWVPGIFELVAQARLSAGGRDQPGRDRSWTV